MITLIGKVRYSIAIASACLVWGFSDRSAASDIIFGGSVSYANEGVVIAGTFSPDFNPYSYKFVYGVDSVGNMEGPRFNQAVADGNFRPIGIDFLSSGEYLGGGVASGVDGLKVWLFAFNSTIPDHASEFALFSDSSASWFVPNGQGSTRIFGNTATEFVFGSGGHGFPIQLQGMPIPEPAPVWLLALGTTLVMVYLRRMR